MSYLDESNYIALIDDYVVDADLGFCVYTKRRHAPIGLMDVTEVYCLDSDCVEVRFEDFDNDKEEWWTLPIRYCLTDANVVQAATTLCRWWRRRVTSSA